MPYAPGPTFVRGAYHSVYGFHTFEIPTRDFIPGSISGDLGQCLAWDGTTVVGISGMIEEYLTLVKALYPSTTSFDNLTLFTQATPTSPPVPQASFALTGVIGTATTPGWHKATQGTLTMRDTGANQAKFVLLDVGSGDSFDPIRSLGVSASVDAIVDLVTDDTQAFSSRAGFKPQTFLGYFMTLNEKLRRAYRMT